MRMLKLRLRAWVAYHAFYKIQWLASQWGWCLAPTGSHITPTPLDG